MRVDPAATVAFLRRREAARQRELDARFAAEYARLIRSTGRLVHGVR